MPIMRMPWSKSGNLQLDLLDAPAAPEAATAPLATTGAAARAPSMVPTASLYEDANNPRTEIPNAELDELADDIRQHGIWQPIVVHPADADGRLQIHFGAKRWRAAQRIGLREVPVVLRDGPTNPYAQVAENQKRHGLTPFDLTRFIRGRIDAGASNTTVAKTLGLDLTTVAHHLALLDLPPVLDAAMKAGRCSSPRTLYELGKLHAEQPERVADLVTGNDPITREAVAEIRDTVTQAPAAASAHKPRTARPSQSAQLLSRAAGLCERLDAALARLGRTDLDALPSEDVAASGHVARLRDAIAQDVPAIVAQLKAAAPAGDVQAARLLLERVIPPLKASEEAAPLALPDGTLTEQGCAVLGAIAAGELGPQQGAALLGAFGTLARVAELDELARRVAVLEGKEGPDDEAA